MLRPLASTALLLIACTSKPPTPPGIVPGIAQVGDTTFVTTEEPGLDGVVTLSERWQQAPDRERFGEITDGVLGATGAVWFTVSGGTDRTAVYRAGVDGALRAIAAIGTDADAVTGTVSLAALADGGVIVIERTTGRAVRFDSLGVAVATLMTTPIADDRALVPDRDGGWFAPLPGSDAWLHYGARGTLTDTLRPSPGWSTDATIGVARDGSWLRAVSGSIQLARRAGDGPILTARWLGASLTGSLSVAHDAKGLAWVGARGTDGSVVLRSFDRDAGLRFIITTPPGARLLDRDGDYLLLLGADGVLRTMEVVSGTP